MAPLIHEKPRAPWLAFVAAAAVVACQADLDSSAGSSGPGSGGWNARDSGISAAGDAAHDQNAPSHDANGSGTVETGAPVSDAGSHRDANNQNDLDGSLVQPPGTVAMLVASGLGYRTTVSYDEGRTWVHDQPIDPKGLDCGAIDCTHHPGNSLGLAYGNAWFFAEFGNVSAGGVDPKIMRSRDAVTWLPSYAGSAGGLAYGNGRLVAGRNPSVYSDDDGVSWKTGIQATPRAGAEHIRRVYFVPFDGGRFLFVLSGPSANDVLVSANGERFERASSLPEDCTLGTLAYGNGILIGSGSRGRVCRSSDGGVSWTASDLNGEDIRSVIRTDTEFIAYHWDHGYRSDDGQSWREFQPTPGGAHIGPTARASSGAFATFRAGNTPGFMRSQTGGAWEAATFVKSYSIQNIVFGYGLRKDAE